jgi:hypothetical protein
MDILDMSQFELDSDANPMQLFEENTYLGYGAEGESKARLIEKICLKQRFFAFIDNDPELGWIFHTILPPAPDRTKKRDPIKSCKKEASLFSDKKIAKQILEEQIVEALIERLKNQGISAEPNVTCRAGIADIVTPSAIYEVKLWLTRDTLFEAIGQVLLYKQSIDLSRQAIIVGVNSGVESLIPIVKEIGIDVEFWQIPRNLPMEKSQLYKKAIKCKKTNSLPIHTDIKVLIEHGVKCTIDDNRRAILAALSDEEWKKWGDREIARLCGVDKNTVHSYRKLNSPEEDDTSKRNYRTRNGRVGQMSTTKKKEKMPKSSNVPR